MKSGIHTRDDRLGVARARRSATSWPEWVFWALLAVTALSGGASQADSGGLLVLRPLTVVLIAIMAAISGPWNWSGIRAPLAVLVLTATWMVVQMIPLPPAIWPALPGHAPLLDAARIAGEAQPWRPITVTPDLSINALLSLLTVLAVLASLAPMQPVDRYKVIFPLIVMTVLGAILGILQVSSGGSFYIYKRTYEDFAVGFFSNRNHHAALLAMSLPMLRVWTLTAPQSAVKRRRLAIAAGCAILIIPTVLLTGSRAGMALAVFGVLAAIFIEPRNPASTAVERRRLLIIRLAILAGLVLLVLAVLLAGRAASFERLTAARNLDGELRVRAMPVLWIITRDFFPFGSGFGSFDPVFRMYEPDALLAPGFFNHAHNDLIEIVLTGGLPAALIVLVSVGILARCAIQARPGAPGKLVDILYLRLAIVMWAIVLTASLVDYPLRSPLMMAVMACATVWATSASARLTAETGRKNGDQVA